MTSANNDFQEEIYNDDFLLAEDGQDNSDDGFLGGAEDADFKADNLDTAKKEIKHIKQNNVDTFLGSIEGNSSSVDNNKEKSKVINEKSSNDNLNNHVNSS